MGMAGMGGSSGEKMETTVFEQQYNNNNNNNNKIIKKEIPRFIYAKVLISYIYQLKYKSFIFHDILHCSPVFLYCVLEHLRLHF